MVIGPATITHITDLHLYIFVDAGSSLIAFLLIPVFFSGGFMCATKAIQTF
jgi:hypothetical protein